MKINILFPCLILILLPYLAHAATTEQIAGGSVAVAASSGDSNPPAVAEETPINPELVARGAALLTSATSVVLGATGAAAVNSVVPSELTEGLGLLAKAVDAEQAAATEAGKALLRAGMQELVGTKGDAFKGALTATVESAKVYIPGARAAVTAAIKDTMADPELQAVTSQAAQAARQTAADLAASGKKGAVNLLRYVLGQHEPAPPLPPPPPPPPPPTLGQRVCKYMDDYGIYTFGAVGGLFLSYLWWQYN